MNYQCLAGITCLFLLTNVAAQDQSADLILQNGVIWTVDTEHPRAEAVASRDDRIVFVGSTVDADKTVNPDDLYGSFFLPNKGMIDGFTRGGVPVCESGSK
jgi:adenine deaminase